MFRFGAVILNRLLKGPERIHRLLEDFHHRDPAHIFRTGFAHHILRRLILRHEFGVFTAHHGEHCSCGDSSRQQAGCAHTPVEHEHQHDRRKEHSNAADYVCKVVSKQGFCLSGGSVQSVSKKPGSVRIEKPKRRFHQMLHAFFTDIACCTECRQMRTHQRCEIDEDSRKRKCKCQPPVTGNTRCLHPVRGCRDQIPRYQPDADIRQHTQDHGHC